MIYVWRILLAIMLLLMGMQKNNVGDVPATNAYAETVFFINDYNINFSFSNEWENVTTDTPFDLQCTNGQSYASVFAYYTIDLAEGETPYDIYEIQKDDIFSRREQVKKVSDEIVYEVNDKRIHSELYSAERDGVKNYYYVNLIELNEQEDLFCWVLFTAIPSYAKANIDEWKAIIASANITTEY